MKSPYHVLGISRQATPAQIKAAYRRAALRWHPDRNANKKTAHARMAEVNAAYAELIEPLRKSKRQRGNGFGPTIHRVSFAEIVAKAQRGFSLSQIINRMALNVLENAVIGDVSLTDYVNENPELQRLVKELRRNAGLRTPRKGPRAKR